jgi:hypothetical protein
MIIHMTPQMRADPLTAERHGDTLVLNGIAHDFTDLPEGAQAIPDSGWFAGPVSRQDGRICLTLILPHGDTAPAETLFPAPLDVQADGPLPLPPYAAPAADPGGDDDA